MATDTKKTNLVQDGIAKSKGLRKVINDMRDFVDKYNALGTVIESADAFKANGNITTDTGEFTGAEHDTNYYKVHIAN